MTHKEELKNLIDQLPEEKIIMIEPFLKNLLNSNKQPIPKGKLGIKKTFDRAAFYDDILANRY